MDIVSIIVQAIVKAIGYLISVAVLMGKPILVSLYNAYISRYLLAPQFAFPNIVNGSVGVGVKELYYFIMFEIYDPLLTIVAIILGLLILLNSSLELGYDFRNLLIKTILVLVLSNISFFLFQDFLYLGSLIYTQLWYFGLPGNSFSSGQNILSGLQIGGQGGSILSFLIIVIFLSLMLYLLLFLALRIAIIYTFPVISPLFTLLIIIPKTQELGERLWLIFFDVISAPILIGIPLILATYVKNNSVLVLGFLALADFAPLMLSISQSSRFTGNFLGRAVNSGMQRSGSMIFSNVGRVIPRPRGPSGNDRGGAGGQPITGSVRKYSSSLGGGNTSSLFFKVKQE